MCAIDLKYVEHLVAHIEWCRVSCMTAQYTLLAVDIDLILLLGSILGGIYSYLFFFQAEDGIRDIGVTGVQTCALPISSGNPLRTARFALDPRAFFEADDEDDLDFALVALGRLLDGDLASVSLSACPLSDSGAKHLVGGLVNVVQHPDGDTKQIVVRENRILHRGDHVLHYLTDTEPGYSGSPVFNDQGEVVALHHWGGPQREVVGADGRPLRGDINGGIRVSQMGADLKGGR